MNSIFWGFFFVLLDFNLTFNTVVISVLPDFIGFILIIKGLDELTSYSPRFSKVRPHAIGMAVYTALLFLGNIMGLSQHPSLSVFLGLIAVGVNLYIQYNIVCGVLDIEADPGIFLNGAVLFSVWRTAAIAIVLSVLMIFIPIINLLAIIASAIASIFFLYQFYQTKKRFIDVPPPTNYTVE